jgi:hypothetical protein
MMNNRPEKVCLDSIAQKYGLSKETIIEEFEMVVSKIMASSLGWPVETVYKSGRFLIQAFPNTSEGLTKVQNIVFKGNPDTLLKEAMQKVEIALEIRRSDALRQRIRHLTHTAVNGRIISFSSQGDLFVEIEQTYNGTCTEEKVVGICRKRRQPIHERGNYFIGDWYRFSVMNVVTVFTNRTPRVEINLSRTSTRLVEALIHEELFRHPDVHENTSVKCLSRIPGIISKILTSHRIPREIILCISDELNERIKVKWQKSFYG